MSGLARAVIGRRDVLDPIRSSLRVTYGDEAAELFSRFEHACKDRNSADNLAAAIADKLDIERAALAA